MFIVRILKRLLVGCLALAAKGAFSQSLTFAVIGDLPYDRFSINDRGQFKAFEGLVDAITQDRSLQVLFHVGDIRSGTQPCHEAYNESIAKVLQKITIPVIYTPGDNEWADCHKEKAFGGRYNKDKRRIEYFVSASELRDVDPEVDETLAFRGGHPLANLRALRKRFFQPSVLRLANLKSISQDQVASQLPDFSEFVENRLVLQSETLFLTINLPGGSNNGTDPWYGEPSASAEQADHVRLRTAATQAWLEFGFKYAKENGAKSVIVLTQADMWDYDGHPLAKLHLTAFKPIIDTLVRLTQAFAKPVLLINGDSHVYRHDNPLAKGQPCFTESTAKGGVIEPCTKGNQQTQSYPNLDPFDNNPSMPLTTVTNLRRIVVHGERLPLEYLKIKVDYGRDAGGIGENFFGPFVWTRVGAAAISRRQ
jgi:hypothetical protein